MPHVMASAKIRVDQETQTDALLLLSWPHIAFFFSIGCAYTLVFRSRCNGIMLATN